MQRWLLWAAPGIFVMLWSTGFIGARLGMPYAEPFTFLFIRFVAVLVLLLPLALYKVRHWPNSGLLMHGVVVGILLHGAYLGGVFFAIDRGMPAGVSALIVSLQPILTLLLATIFIGEKAGWRTILLFVIGLFGVGMVLLPNLYGTAISLSVSSIMGCIIALVGICLGTVYQKQFATGMDFLAGLVAQYAGATLVVGLLAYFTETMVVEWNGEFIFAMFWLVFVLSLGAVALLMFLIGRDSVSRTSALFFLVPGFTVLVAFIMFDEQMNLTQLAGLFVASAAVALVNMQKA